MSVITAFLIVTVFANEGIPITDPTVLAKCGPCHPADSEGRLATLSALRATPEGWQNALRRMIRDHGLTVTPLEARAIVKDLSNAHGLAPAEAAPIRYSPERRIQPETNIPTEEIATACAKCHSFGAVLSWRRSPAEWKQYVTAHAARQKSKADVDSVTALLSKLAPLSTPEFEAWQKREAVNLTGRWWVSATLPGRGKYIGEMEVGGRNGDFNARTKLTSLADNSTIDRNGRGVLYADSAWRGRSAGGPPTPDRPADPLTEAREVMTFTSPTQAVGRWFWGQYQEFGFDVHWQRADATTPVLLALDQASLKAGTRGNRLRFLGANFPSQGTPADLNLGPGLTVRSIVSRTPRELVAEVDVAADAPPGRRPVQLYGSGLTLAIYDRVDYIKLTPESAVASFSDPAHPKGYMQFEAIGYHRGRDGRLHTADDVELGPVDVTWSLEVFHAPPGLNAAEKVGAVSPSGLFTPASESPNANFDVWISATAKTDKNPINGKPLIGKAYLVVSPPTYTINGRRYVRDLDHWIDDGPANQ